MTPGTARDNRDLPVASTSTAGSSNKDGGGGLAQSFVDSTSPFGRSEASPPKVVADVVVAAAAAVPVPVPVPVGSHNQPLEEVNPSVLNAEPVSGTGGSDSHGTCGLWWWAVGVMNVVWLLW